MQMYKTTKCIACSGKGHIVALNGEWMKAKRKELGLSLRGVAKKLGVSASYINDIENERRQGNAKIIGFYESR